MLKQTGTVFQKEIVKNVGYKTLKPVPKVAKDFNNKKLDLLDYFGPISDKYNFKTLYGAPTIFNHEKSSHNSRGIIKALRKSPSGVYYNPSETSTFGLTFSEVIPKAFLAENDLNRKVFEQLPHNIENKLRDENDFNVAPTVYSKSEIFNLKNGIETDLTKIKLTDAQIEEIVSKKEKFGLHKVANEYKIPVAVVDYIAPIQAAKVAELEKTYAKIQKQWNNKQEQGKIERNVRKEQTKHL
ncbi:hypothetical protein QEN19_002348 [Hanseniaspora menglaensis]